MSKKSEILSIAIANVLKFGEQHDLPAEILAELNKQGYTIKEIK